MRGARLGRRANDVIWEEVAPARGRKRPGRRYAPFVVVLAALGLSALAEAAHVTPGSRTSRAQAPANAARAPTPVAPPVRRFTLIATGDVIVHRPVASRARTRSGYDFRPMLADVAPLLRAADLALCHLETPLDASRPLGRFPVFNAPAELADALAWAGYDGCSTASNHSLDQRAAGVAATLDALERAGLGHAGTARRADEPSWRLYVVNGVRLGHLSYTYGFNGFAPPHPWLVNRLDPSRVLTDARAARGSGAEFVVVSVHWGTEYRSVPTPDQVRIAQALLSAPEVDLVVGHHAHVVQPVARVGAKYVAYGVGNFLTAQNARCCGAAAQDGAMLVFTVDDSEGGLQVREVAYVPTWVEPGSYRVLPAVASSAEPHGAVLAASSARTAHTLGSAGVRPAVWQTAMPVRTPVP